MVEASEEDVNVRSAKRFLDFRTPNPYCLFPDSPH
jgi:hypothetical protein